MTGAGGRWLKVYHEQYPRHDAAFWLVVLLLPVVLVAGVFWLRYCFGAGQDWVGARALLMVAACWLILWWVIFPRKYQILSGGIRVVLGGTFSFFIPFNSIKKVEYPSEISCLWRTRHRFVACFDPEHYIWIQRGNVMGNAMISPQNPSLFIKNLVDVMKKNREEIEFVENQRAWKLIRGISPQPDTPLCARDVVVGESGEL
jgi:ABC-type iron transport system FetAB permease component